MNRKVKRWAQVGSIFCILFGWSMCARCYAQDAAVPLPEGKQGVQYEFRFEAEGAVGATIWRVTSRELPPGLILDASGRLHGVPLTAKNKAYNFDVEVTDSASAPRHFAQTFALRIQPAPLRIKQPTALRIRPVTQETAIVPAIVTQPDTTLASMDNASHGASGPLGSNNPSAQPPRMDYISPAKTDTVRVGKLELRFRVNDPGLQTFSLTVKDKDGKEFAQAQDQELKRGYDIAHSVITLQPGKNVVTVTAAGENISEATLSWELTYAPTREIRLVTPPSEGDAEVFGEGAMPNAEIKVVRGDTELTETIKANHKGQFFWYPPAKQPLAAGERLSFKQKTQDGPAFSPASDFVQVLSVEEKDDLRAGSPQGFIFGGLVLSQQAQEFKQADPFIGFEAGYRFGAFRKKGSETPYNRGQFQFRFFGVFQSAPRAVEPKSGGAEADPLDFKPFISSRKSFDTGVRLWYEAPRFSRLHTLGVYGLWGASTTLSKTELEGESALVKTDDEDSGTAVCTVTSGSATVTSAKCAAKIDNDIKQFKEVGLWHKVDLFNRKLFLENTLGFGHYEALKGLAPCPADDAKCVKHKTQNRFIGRLRITPDGLNQNHGGQRALAPYLGIEVNAGYGPDQIKFYIGSIIRLKGLNF